ncbi:hypothetical protein [Sphingomonas sp. LB2R24]|uniref:hypothetical protein n=1 Tax=Sphingomonas sorbitolis TaxID=3096165 RepID=UPI002FC9FF20
MIGTVMLLLVLAIGWFAGGRTASGLRRLGWSRGLAIGVGGSLLAVVILAVFWTTAFYFVSKPGPHETDAGAMAFAAFFIVGGALAASAWIGGMVGAMLAVRR